MDNSLRPNRWKVLQIINMGTLISTLDVGIVNVSLPTMADQFGVSLATIQWVATAYLLTMVALLPFLGKLSDRTNRRLIYSFGFLIFGAGSACVAWSGGFLPMLLSRVLQGVGAAMIMANSQAMVRELFPDRERGRALGMNAVVISIGTLSGPALGGLLLELIDWPWLFWINVPIAFVAFVLGLILFPSTEPGTDRSPIDFLGIILLAGGTCALLYAAETSKLSSDGSSTTALFAIAGTVMLAALWPIERRIPYGIIDRELFQRRKIWLGNTHSFFINVSQTATLIPIAFYLQGPLGLSTGATGFLLILQPLLMGITAPAAGWFRDKYGGFFPILLGSAFCAVSMLFVVLSPIISTFSIGLQLGLFGVGIGLFHATNNAEIMSDAPKDKISLAGSLLAMVRYLGNIGGIGLAALFVGSMGSSTAPVNTVELQMRLLFGLCFLICIGVTASGKLRPKNY